MITPYLAVAWALLTAPPGTPIVEPPPDRWPGLALCLQRVAIQQEWMEEADCTWTDGPQPWHLFTRRDRLQHDCDVIRRHAVELRDCPRLIEASQFPSIDANRDGRCLNRRYRDHLFGRLAWEQDRAGMIGLVIEENERLYQVWNLADDAVQPYFGVVKRRTALRKLRELLGEDDYQAGRLPPPVPVWRFNEGR